MEIGLWGFIGILVMSPVLVVAGIYIAFLVGVVALFVALVLEWIFKGINWTAKYVLDLYKSLAKS